MTEDMPGGRRKLRKIFMFVMAAALGVAVAVCSVSFGQERRVPVYGVDTDKKQVEIIRELDTSADTIESLTGKRPTLFRPPYGSYSNRLIDTAESLGYQTIQWSVDACGRLENAECSVFR